MISVLPLNNSIVTRGQYLRACCQMLLKDAVISNMFKNNKRRSRNNDVNLVPVDEVCDLVYDN